MATVSSRNVEICRKVMSNVEGFSVGYFHIIFGH